MISKFREWKRRNIIYSSDWGWHIMRPIIGIWGLMVLIYILSEVF